MKHDHPRCLWFEELEPRTPLAADFLAGYVLPPEATSGQIPTEIRSSLQNTWTGSIDSLEPKIQLNPGSPNGLPEGLYYLKDSMILRIHLMDSEQVPLNSGRLFRLVISFDPEYVSPEGSIWFPGDDRCEWESDNTANELSFCLKPDGLDSLTLDVPFQVSGVGSSAFAVAILHWDPEGSVGASEVALKASAEFTVKEAPQTTGPISIDRPTDQAVFDGSSFGRVGPAPRAAGLIGVRPLTPRTPLAKSLEDSLPLSLASEKRESNSLAESSIRLLRRPAARATPDWEILNDATANLFLPLELNELDGQVGAAEQADQRVTRLVGSRDRTAKENPPEHASAFKVSDVATWLAKPSYMSRVATTPGVPDQYRDPLSLRLITADEIDAVFAAWRTPPTPRDDEP